MTTTTKFYARRDSATTVLRKAGIPARDYQLYLKKSGDGVELDMSLLNKHLSASSPNAFQGPKTTSKARFSSDQVFTLPTKQVKAAEPAKKQAKVTVSSVARELLKQGMSNEQVWEQLKATFKLDDGKKHYPAWYRAQMKRDGLL